MDVIASRLPAQPDPVTTRFVRSAGSPSDAPGGPEPPAPATHAEAAPPSLPDGAGTRWLPSLSFKFCVTAADVDARFEIDETTSRVTVTMFDHKTGQLIHDIPSHHVRDAIARVAVSGLRVDATS